MAQVLVIDDEPAVANMVKASLQTSFSVELCSDSERALAQIREGARYNAIVCDVHLSRFDGPALFDQIKVFDPAQAQRMLFVTGGINDQSLIDRVKSTHCLLIHKPYRLSQLIQAVGSIVSAD